ncbi:acrB/AcrD/AcrF family domain protein, partial [Vibrio parahaemolyticus 10296]
MKRRQFIPNRLSDVNRVRAFLFSDR